MRAPNVFTISPALPFLETFVAAFRAGEVVPGFAAGDDPLGLADCTIYVPTRRAALALRETFLRTARGPSLLPPRILPLGALEATETELILAEPDPAAAGLPLPPAASQVWRRLRLAQLIQSWAKAIGGALRYVDATGREIVDETEPFQVATSAVDAFALAGDLASLIDEMLIEDVQWRDLNELNMASFDDYWRITTTFLAIAVESWPKMLEEAGFVDLATRQIALVDAQARQLGEGRVAGPVVAIGSTGTNRATARLLAAIARAPQGAVVLPGLDQDLDDVSFALAAAGDKEGREPSHGHPQSAMARLLPILGIARADVRALCAPEPVRADRVRLVSEALRPADTTELWRPFRKKMPQKAMAAALSGVTLIEAADEREEALCLAIALREALETPGRTAALITPDRELARRVRGELLRWNVEIADTGGESLASRPLGVLARLVAAAAASGLAARDMTALLGHPLAAFGRPRAEIARLARDLEIGVLRVVQLDGRGRDEIFAEARAAAAEATAHAAQKAIREETWETLGALWDEVATCLAPLRGLDGTQSLKRWVTAHRAAVKAVAASADAIESESLDALFDELSGDAADLGFDAGGYAVLFGRLAGEITLRNTDSPHPRLAVYGLLEARLIPADVVLLGGLDETIWPPQPRSDPFLNRPMRAALGLSSPERRIGQTAHDFAQAMGHHTVIISRAKKRGGSPTVASRFLLRLAALAEKVWDPVRARGAAYVELAHALDRPLTRPKPATRPFPKPDVALRPTRLSVTRIETLRRDPYAIFASHVLRIAPLPQVGTALDFGELGSRMHDALHAFASARDAGGSPQVRRDKLLAILEQEFAHALRDPSFRAFRWTSLQKAADLFLAFDAGQRALAREITTETTGKLDLLLADGSPFVLSARADRIDFHRDGSALLVDYKTGQPPGLNEVKVGFAPQLTLEAAILRDGGFGRSHPGAISATYVKLGGRDGGRLMPLNFKDDTFDAVVERHFAGAQRLLSAFRNKETSYPSRPFPKFAKAYGDYDHLARVREWSLAGEEDA